MSTPTEGTLVEPTTPAPVTGTEPGGTRRAGFASLGIDTRLLGMVGALVIIWVVFHVATGGRFITAQNLWNLSVQTSVVAIMATGMVLIIVSRNIDLSVGSVMGFVGIGMALLQARILPNDLGLGLENPLTLPITLAVGLLVGALIGAFHGFLVAYIGVPAFIVTLGGLLVWRGLAWALASGQTVAPMDTTFRKLGGGADGAVGETTTWIIAGVACVAIVLLLANSRRQRRRVGFEARPLWADAAIGVAGCAVVIIACWVANSYFLPENLARAYALRNDIPWPEEGTLQIPFGIAYPVIIAIGVAIVMTYIATRRRFGRYVFAIGGNPDAAELGGINTRRTILLSFALMGVLCAIAAAVQIARLNAGPSSLGTLAELSVIAAAVIGGTSFAGGIGTVPGAVLGALVMQSLQSGMVLMRVDAPIQDVAAGSVLVFAVAVDTILRRRST
ncbi:MAG: sugar ABC transporter permease [Chloroflexi bacterium]|nr:sugar ABC transporter permease [Chloroflexota bacterium]